jgi:hypothetical protein
LGPFENLSPTGAGGMGQLSAECTLFDWRGHLEREVREHSKAVLVEEPV